MIQYNVLSQTMSLEKTIVGIQHVVIKPSNKPSKSGVPSKICSNMPHVFSKVIENKCALCKQYQNPPKNDVWSTKFPRIMEFM
jgi:hypothetical protein